MSELAAGDILKEALLVIEEYTVKANEDIEKARSSTTTETVS